MKYFANLEKLSIKLKENSPNLEQYLYGVESERSARWNEIIFLLQLCHDTMCAPARDADARVLSRKPLPDTRRIKEIEFLIASILIDEYKPNTFGEIYALRPRPLSHEVKPSRSSSRVNTFRSISLLIGRDPTRMECLDSSIEPWKYGEMFDEIGSRRSRKLLELSSDFYLIYLALGELADLKHTIDIFQRQKLPEWTSLDSSDTPPIEIIVRGSPPRPMGEDTIFFCEYFHK